MNPKGLIALAVAGVVIWLVAVPASLPERPTEILDADELVQVICEEGERIELAEHLRVGRFTVVEFNAPW